MGVVVLKLEIFVLETENILHIGIDAHGGQWARVAGELQFHLLQMVKIDVCVAQCVYKVASLQACDLRHHHQQQGVRGYVEGYTQKTVGTALVELQAQAAVGHIELEEGVARGEVHVVQVGHVPSTHNDAARSGIVLDGLYRFLYLVDMSALVVGP